MPKQLRFTQKNPHRHMRQIYLLLAFTGFAMLQAQANPVITATPYQTFCSYDSPFPHDPVCEGPVSFPFSVSDLCDANEGTIRVYLDLFSDGSFPFDHQVQRAPGGTLSGAIHVFRVTGTFPQLVISSMGQGLPLGRHKFVIHIEDECGNVGMADAIVEVLDCLAPVPICINGLSGGLFPIDVDNDGNPDDGIFDIFGHDFLAASVSDCSLPVRYSLRRESQAPDINRIGITFSCADITPGMFNNIHIVYVDAWDMAGNRGHCENYVIVSDIFDLCPTPAIPGVISGFIRTESGDPLTGLDVSLNGSADSTIQTDDEGYYAFNNLGMWDDYYLWPVSWDDYTTGISTLDLLLIRQHILGMQLLDSPYMILAADVNNSQTVTILDVITLQRLLLGHIDELPGVDSWRFIPAGYTFPQPGNPWVGAIPAQLYLYSSAPWIGNQNFVAVKMGDVNNSATEELQAVELRRDARKKMAFHIADRSVEAGEIVEVEFRSRDMDKIRGFQFSLGFPASVLALRHIEYGVLTESNFGTRFADAGHIEISWHEANPQDRPHPDEVLFRLIFKSESAGQLKNLLHLSAKKLRPEAYDLALNHWGVSLHFDGTAPLSDRFEMYPVRPNPVREEANIEFFLPGASAGTLRFTDVQGRVLHTAVHEFVAGFNQVSIPVEAFPTGVIFCTLEAGEHRATRKVVVIR
jgi:hypothetical protein